jgi:putative oxidoreductase
MVGIVFTDSGRHPQNGPRASAKAGILQFFSGLPGLGVVLGIWPQLAVLGLIMVMLGSIYEKIFVWHTGFWGEKTYGWHYDLMLLVMIWL